MSSIGENADGLNLSRTGPTAFCKYGLGFSVTTPRTTRPSDGRDDEATSRPATLRWCL